MNLYWVDYWSLINSHCGMIVHCHCLTLTCWDSNSSTMAGHLYHGSLFVVAAVWPEPEHPHHGFLFQDIIILSPLGFLPQYPHNITLLILLCFFCDDHQSLSLKSHISLDFLYENWIYDSTQHSPLHNTGICRGVYRDCSVTLNHIRYCIRLS